MEVPGPSIHDPDSKIPTHAAPNLFSLTADSPIASHLAPSNLPITRITRAWDRRPQSPFSRKKVRFGKVWKRNASSYNNHAAASMFSGAFEPIGAESPARAVKKMRTADGEVVNEWEGRGSPTNRRIVTRGNRDNEELLELAQEESMERGQDVQQEALNIEVINDDGTIHQVYAEDEVAQEDWEDESTPEKEEDQAELVIKSLAEEEGSHSTPIESMPGADVVQQSEDADVRSHDQTTDGLVVPAESDTTQIETMSAPTQATAIPEGFVSPVKTRQRRSIRQVKEANANRRRTLPVSFAAQQTQSSDLSVKHAGTTTGQDVSQVAEDSMQVEQEPERASPMVDDPDVKQEATVQLDVQQTTDELGEEKISVDGEWEDVEEETEPEPSRRAGDVTPEVIPQYAYEDTVENTPSSEEEAIEDAHRYTQQLRERLEMLTSPSKLSSPIPSISGPHPRLPLRRSPRRQSTSPLRRHNVLPDKPHFVAFTPIKMPVYRSTGADSLPRSSPLPNSPATHPTDDKDLQQLTRSSSAPPEEPQMSPQKPKQPRMSDDTALLQAFLKRANDSKNGTNMTETARRESFENRRNSDTVRQALASPVVNVTPAEVLADRDPNSPSPRKPIILTESQDKQLSDQQDDEIEFDPLSPKRTSRRSGRSKKKTTSQVLPTAANSGPNKITFRGSADPIVLKKTEAQELAQLTRTNTRKNKGGSVLPPLKLTRMAKDGTLNGLPEETDPATEIDMPGRRGIKWAETLVSYYEGDNALEMSTMTDELNAPEPALERLSTSAEQEVTGVPAAVPPSETPSKPKIRRLKPPKTASTPVKPTLAADAEPAQSDQTRQVKPKATTTMKRKSRLATPAKSKDGITAAVIDPPLSKDDGPASGSAPDKAVAEKKKPASRLLPPGSIAKPVAQGKENSLIASPTKKRPVKSADTRDIPTAKAFAPKLDFTSADAKGISSPAKRVARGKFYAGGLVEDVGSVVNGRQELPASLGSPAKKRSRRIT